MARWSDDQTVSQSVSQSLSSSVFLSFCLFVFLSFILVHWQADTRVESFFELTRVNDGIHFKFEFETTSVLGGDR